MRLQWDAFINTAILLKQPLMFKTPGLIYFVSEIWSQNCPWDSIWELSTWLQTELKKCVLFIQDFRSMKSRVLYWTRKQRSATDIWIWNEFSFTRFNSQFESSKKFNLENMKFAYAVHIKKNGKRSNQKLVILKSEYLVCEVTSCLKTMYLLYAKSYEHILHKSDVDSHIYVMFIYCSICCSIS